MFPTTRVTPGLLRGSPRGRFQAAFGIVSPPHAAEARIRKNAQTSAGVDEDFKRPPEGHETIPQSQYPS
jgi:hypothetical protein